MEKHVFSKEANVYLPDGYTISNKYSVLYLLDGNMTEQMGIPEMIQSAFPKKYIIVTVTSQNRDDDYTPRPMENVFPNLPPFGGHSQRYMEKIQKLVAEISKAYSVKQDCKNRVLMGYSLGGLFALEAFLRDSTFGICASLSGSLWYTGVPEDCKNSNNPGEKKLYLSLGDKESKGNHPSFSINEERHRKVVRILRSKMPTENICFEVNKGDHVENIVNRYQRGLLWIDEKIK